MKLKGKLFFFAFVLSVFFSALALPNIANAEPPSTFEKAKALAKTEIYYDRGWKGELYCGCHWDWKRGSGGVIQPETCGLDTSKLEESVAPK